MLAINQDILTAAGKVDLNYKLGFLNRGKRMSDFARASRWIVLVAVMIIVAGIAGGCKSTATITENGYTYKKVKGDPLGARIYTLDNGLRVYMTVYRDEPRIEASVAVRAGSRTDPDTATGLAHCLEHMMFKGTDELGTANYDLEQVALDRITELFDCYCQTSDTIEAKRIYHKIDSISYHASKYAIAGEYDKTMSALGAKKTNAHTGVDGTVYTNEIPSNKVTQWLEVEYERFKDPVFRLFHTELAAIFEEKNAGLDSDYRKARQAVKSGLWGKHPYGTHTILGSVEHLGNMSITKLVDYFNTYYVPGNMALCISGDINPDSLIKMVDDTFGRLEPANPPEFVSYPEEPLSETVIKEVVGPDREMVIIGFRFPGEGSREAKLLRIADWLLMNGTAGIMDINLRQTQKVISPYCMADINKDYSSQFFAARPREGQSLEEVKELLLSQLELLKEGEFPVWLPQAAANVLQIIYLEKSSSNKGRVQKFVDAFLAGIPWEGKLAEVENYQRITKEDLVKFANKYYRNNYAVVYKRTGESNKGEKIRKPEITPVELDREIQSEFAARVMSMESPEIEPVFLDFGRDIQWFTVKNDVPVLYRHNEENDLFNMYYVLDMGSNHNPTLKIAMEYLPYLGTESYSNSEFKQELFKQGCLFRTSTHDDIMYITIHGLGKNFESSIELIEELFSNAESDSAVLANLVEDIIKNRSEDKLDKDVILHRAMESYAMYGKHSPYTNRLSTSELRNLNGQELVEIIRRIKNHQHRILYYGPHGKDELADLLNEYHQVPEKLLEIPPEEEFEQLPMKRNIVYVCDYDMRQAEIIFLSRSVRYNEDNVTVRKLFNEYYDGNMGSVVFQTLRESRGLAYSVEGCYITPDNWDECHYVYGYIGTQADKLPEAMAGMYDLLNVFPESEKCFEDSKESILNQIRTERITKSDILFQYESQKRLGIGGRDIREKVFNQLPSVGMEELRNFFNEYVRDRKYTILLLGDTGKLDFDVLEQYGEVRELNLEEIFGY